MLWRLLATAKFELYRCFRMTTSAGLADRSFCMTKPSDIDHLCLIVSRASIQS